MPLHPWIEINIHYIDDEIDEQEGQREDHDRALRSRKIARCDGADGEPAGDLLEASGVRMDVEAHAVTVDGRPVKLALKEFELLEILLRNAGRVLTRGQLIDRVWGADYVGDTKTLDVHVKRLRAKIEADPAVPVHLVTVRGLGYKFEG